MFGGDPFGGMFGGGYRGNDAFSQMDAMMQNFFQDPFFSAPFGGHPPPPYGGFGGGRGGSYRSGGVAPSIEEVPSHEHHRSHTASNTDGQPIVEEPDEEEEQQDGHAEPVHEPPYSRPRRARAGDIFGGSSLFEPFGQLAAGMMNGGGGGGGGGSFYSSSSSFSSSFGGDREPITYSSSSTTRMGPGGVRETQRTVRDSRTREDSMTISRGLGGRERTTTRTRDGSGKMRTEDRLNGITSDQAQAFDQEWQQQAHHSLPSFGLGRRGDRGTLNGGASTAVDPRYRLEGGSDVGGGYGYGYTNGGRYV